MEKCPVPDCVGHLVERTNRHTGVKFMGCSEWPKTKCSGRVKYVHEDDWDAVSGDYQDYWDTITYQDGYAYEL